MNNAISRLLEATTAEAPAWFNKLSPEAQERYLSLHPQSSLHGQGGSGEEESHEPSNDDYDRAFDEHKHGVTDDEKKGQKSTDVVPYGEKRGADGEFESKKPDENKTGTDVVPKGKRKNDDVTDVDFKEIPRGEKEKPQLNAPEKKPEAPKSEAPKVKAPEKKPEDKKAPGKEAPKAPEQKKEAPKKAPEKKSEKPSAVDRIKEDEDDEKGRRAERAEERREEKHQHQMDVMRRKEQERQDDRAEKKKKAEDKEGQPKPEDKKPPEAKGNEKKPVPKKDEKKSDKKDDKKDNKKSGGGFGEKKSPDSGGSSGSRSDPAAEQHKPTPTPNDNGGPNPNGKEGGSDSAVKRLQDSGGDFSPVAPSGTPSKPTPPKGAQHTPSLPDDTDVNFEDEPSSTPAPKAGQPSPESEKPGASGSEFESQSPAQPGGNVSPSEGGPESKSEAPKVEEKPGQESESVETPEAPGSDGAQFQQQDEGGESAPAPEGQEQQLPTPSENGPETQEHAPMPGEPAPESEQPNAEAPAPFEQNQPEAPAAETPKMPEVPSADNAVDRLRDPDETPTNEGAPDIGKDEPRSEAPEKEDQGQQSKGFGAPPAGGMNAPKPGSGSKPSGGPEQGGGQPQGGHEGVQQQQLDSPNDPFATKAPNIPGDEHHMPKPAEQQAPHEQVNGTPTAPNSQARTKSAQAIRSQAPNIAQRLMKDTVGVPKGLAAMYNILEGRGTAQDGRAALSLLGTILGTAATMAATGAGGPLGFATFMAIKHAGIPAMVAIVKNAFNGSKPTVNPEHQQEDLTRLVQSAADYAQSGNIPAQAWQAGVKEAQQQRG